MTKLVNRTNDIGLFKRNKEYRPSLDIRVDFIRNILLIPGFDFPLKLVIKLTRKLHLVCFFLSLLSSLQEFWIGNEIQQISYKTSNLK